MRINHLRACLHNFLSYSVCVHLTLSRAFCISRVVVVAEATGPSLKCGSIVISIFFHITKDIQTVNEATAICKILLPSFSPLSKLSLKKIQTVARMFKEGKGEIVFEKETRKRKIESFWPGRKKNNFAKRDGNFYRCTLSGSRILLGIICTSVHGAAIRSQKTNDPSNCQGNIGIKKEKEKKKKKKVHAFSALSRKSLSPDLLR